MGKEVTQFANLKVKLPMLDGWNEEKERVAVYITFI